MLMFILGGLWTLMIFLIGVGYGRASNNGN